MTTSTFYSVTLDGGIDSESGVYATARAGNQLGAATGLTSVDVGQSTAGAYEVLEAFFYWDTSAIDDTDTIDSATLSLYGNFDNSTTDFVMEARAHTWSGSGLTTADWVAGADLSGKTLLATFNTSGFSTSAYNDFTSDAAFVSNISKTGNTELLVCSKEQTDNSAPTTAEWVRVSTADVGGTTQDPKLVVFHTTTVVVVTETDLAQAMSKRKLKALTQASTTDTARSFSKLFIASSTTDTAQGLSKRKTKLIAQPIETDTAGTFGKTKTKAFSGPTEASSATKVRTFGPPQNLAVVTISGTQLDLSWDAVATASKYQVERDGLPVAVVAGVTYSDTGLTPATSYDYRVRALRVPQ